MSKTILFQTIQFSISSQFSSISPRDTQSAEVLEYTNCTGAEG